MGLFSLSEAKTLARAREIERGGRGRRATVGNGNQLYVHGRPGGWWPIGEGDPFTWLCSHVSVSDSGMSFLLGGLGVVAMGWTLHFPNQSSIHPREEG